MGLFYNYKFKLPELVDSDYGNEWPQGRGGITASQVTKELVGFRLNGSRAGFLSRFEHGLNAIRLIWPNEVKLFRVWTHYKTGEKVVIWNHYFIRCFKALCSGSYVALTGCSSSGKTFACAVYALLMFISNPIETMIMVSTTPGS